MLLTSSRGWNQSSRVCGVWSGCSCGLLDLYKEGLGMCRCLLLPCTYMYLFVDDTLKICLYLSNSNHPFDLFQIQISKASTWSRSSLA
jgi:hypothetical protein